MRRSGMDRSDRDRGQATVEFALILPLLVFCIAGIVWVGQVMVTQVRLEHAAREGARAAAVQPGEATERAAAAVAQVLPGAGVSVSTGSEFVRVEITVESSGLPLIGVGSRTLEADAVMRREDILE